MDSTATNITETDNGKSISIDTTDYKLNRLGYTRGTKKTWVSVSVDVVTSKRVVDDIVMRSQDKTLWTSHLKACAVELSRLRVLETKR